MKQRKKLKYLFFLVVSVGLIIWIVWTNIAIELNEYQIKSEELPETFEGFRIVQVSDLHNTEIGEENTKLLKLIENAKPDIIVITGDIVDSYHTDVEVSLRFVEKAVRIAPCYYVTGNHEARFSKEFFQSFEEKLKEYGVQVLHDESVMLEKDGEYILLAGLDDPTFASNHKGIRYSNLSTHIKELFSEEGFHILLSHRPELFETYVEADVDLVFSGHAHGGQFRLPFVGGLVAPNQGFFPEYDAGLFLEDGTNMVVSRGIGNSIIPVRFHNRPEVIVVELSN